MPLTDFKSLSRNKLVLRTLLFIFLASLWEGAGLGNPFFFSRPSAIALKLANWIYTGFILEHFLVTLQEVVLGFIAGFALGIVTGILLGSVKYLARLLDPFQLFLYALPRIALIPLFIVWFGFGLGFKVVVIFFMVYFTVHYIVYYGMRDVDLSLINVLRVMKASKWDIYRKVIFPYITLWIFTCLKITFPLALMGAIVAEFLSANKGLGYVIFRAGSAFDIAGVFAGLVLLGLFAVLVDILLKQVEARVLRWHVGAKAYV